MAIAINALTSGAHDTTGNATTSSITPASNALVICAVTIGGASGAEPTVSGCGLTWVKINGTTYPAGKGAFRGVWVFRAMGASPSTGALTITVLGTNICHWSVFEFTGVPTTGTNGSGAVQQSVTQNTAFSDLSVTATLGAFQKVENWTVGCAGDGSNAMTVGSGFTEIHAVSTVSPTLLTQYKNSNDTSVEATRAAASGGAMSMVAFEVGEPASSGQPAFFLNFI